MRVVKGSLQSDEARGVVFFNVFKGQPVRGERQMCIHGKLTLETAPNMQTTEMDFVSENRLQWRRARVSVYDRFVSRFTREHAERGNEEPHCLS